MQLKFHREHGSFKSTPTAEHLPGFMVITGANGAGKTQFLDAIRDGAIGGDWEHHLREIVSFTSSELGADSLNQSSGITRRVIVENLERQVSQFLMFAEPEDQLYANFASAVGLSQSVIGDAEQRSGKRMKDWVRSDFEQYTPFEHSQTLFQWSVGDTFLRYSTMRNANDFNRWLETVGKPHDPWLSDAEFVSMYGPEPWTLVNDVFSSLGLPYTIPAPPVHSEETPFAPRLVSEAEALSISPSQLSSGEKTLVQIALAAYSSTYRSKLARMPRILLLDEPDSTLHPSMVKNMLYLLHDVLATKLGIRVFMTTHSPTTVALAPEEALYVMERSGSQRLHKVSRDEALRSLLVGVPAISVSSENRRVVFTESPHDVDRYTEIFSALRPHIESELTLSFVAAGKNKESGNGCDEVISVVKKLRENGNISVWGLVDRDNRTKEPDQWVVFNDERHSIENVLFDPFTLGLLLLLDGERRTVDAVPNSTGLGFQDVDAQTIVDSVMTRVLGVPDDVSRQDVEYRNGLTVSVYRAWLNMNGHDLKKQVLEKIPHLNRYAQKENLAREVIRRVWAQDVGRVPVSVQRTFLRLLEA